VKEIYARRGITNFYDWQLECLNSPSLLNGKNLIFSLPTSGGKTLVAEITLLRWAVLHQKKTLFVLPCNSHFFRVSLSLSFLTYDCYRNSATIFRRFIGDGES
jgi:hypothetical protein